MHRLLNLLKSYFKAHPHRTRFAGNHLANLTTTHGPASQLLEILIELVQNREVASLAALRPDKHTTVAAALEVPLALDGPIILARRFVERDADPGADARDLWDEAGEAHRASAGIGVGEEAHAAAYSETCMGEKRVSLLVSARRVKFDDAGEGVRVASEMRHWAAR